MEPVMRSHSNDSTRPDDTDTDTDPSEAQHQGPQSFGQRHGLKIMAIVMALMFGTVIFAQVAC